ncbi:glycosyltransferase family 4 protein [Methanothermobacter marburgensis]|uniref:glycosyltransferase family 4 protein n=1 Tax=Methanothermobacter marburgensis TaxID=145263 RepID=UPI0035B7CA41
MKILFIHQGPHKVHAEFAKSITDRWQFYGNDRKSIIKIFLRSIIKDKYNADVVFSEGGSGLPLAVLKRLKNPQTKIILLNADKFFYLISRTSFPKRWLMSFLISFVDHIIAVSEMNKRFASDYFDSTNISVVNAFGVNVSFDINCRIDTSNILFIGDHRISDKRFDNLVEALNLLNKDKEGKFRLYLIGSCCDVVEEDFNWLHKVGFTKHPEEYFSECSIYVHPAEFDPFPVSVLEAMSAGIIPIITENTGQSDVLKKHGLGFLIMDDNEPANIAKKILEIYSKPVEWKKEVSLKCKEISRIFSKENQVKKFKKTFNEILEKL